MRKISYETMKNTIRDLAIASIYDLDESVILRLTQGLNSETKALSKVVISEIIENAKIAKEKRIPICQDTGIVVVFLEIGNEVHFDFLIDDAINEGIKDAYENERFRMSVVRHPLDRVNTFTNTPCIIHVKNTLGDKVKITVCPKGAGSENLSQFKMLLPHNGVEGVVDFVLEAVEKAGGKVCPPMIVGVGIGGNFEECALYSKQALLRPIDDESSDPIARDLEKRLYQAINDLDIGPMGIGGKTTALAVKVNVGACHIAALPVAVNFQCHASRHKEVIL
jgi:fumarate hydratase subunit alpha